jgi:DNA-binding transcriptional LysR family regulator
MTDYRRRLPPLSALAAFDASARLSSFTKAAVELGITQAAVSRQIKSLESFLEAQVFVRLHRGVRLTPEGERLQAAVNLGLGHIAEVVGDLQRQGGSAVTLSSTIAFAAFWLVPRLESFRLRHPTIDLKLLTAEHFTDLARERVDLAIRFGHGNWPGFAVAPLFSDEVMAVCSPAYLATRPAPLATAELPKERLLHQDISDSSWISWGHWLRQQGVVPAGRLHGPRFNNYTLVIQAALAGQGLALGWRRLIDPMLSAGTLVAATPDRLATQYAYHLVSRPLAELAPAAGEVRQWILEEAAAPS